jgi:hypothetical protein
LLSPVFPFHLLPVYFRVLVPSLDLLPIRLLFFFILLLLLLFLLSTPNSDVVFGGAAG